QAAEREVGILPDVLGHAGALGSETDLHLVEDVLRDQGLEVASHGDAPIRDIHAPDVELTAEQALHGRLRECSPMVTLEPGDAQSLLDLGDRAPASSEVDEGLLHHRCPVGIQDETRSTTLAAAIANRRLERPAAALERRAHAGLGAIRLDV